jgi:hypothetical protein
MGVPLFPQLERASLFNHPLTNNICNKSIITPFKKENQDEPRIKFFILVNNFNKYKKEGVMMEVQEFQEVTNKIAQNLNNQALVTELLQSLNEGYSTVKTTFDTVSKQTSDYEKEIKTLQQTNMNLFLKVSQQPIAPEQTGKTEPLKYEDVIKSLGV